MRRVSICRVPICRIQCGGRCVYAGMDLEKPSAAPPGTQAEGCLAVAIRVPVRIVVLVLVVPVRMVWDALVVGGRFLRDTLLRPLGRALGQVLGWVGRALFVWPWVALWRYVALPIGRVLARLGEVLLVVPAVWLYRTVLTPVGHALAWAARGPVPCSLWCSRGPWPRSCGSSAAS